MQFSQQSSVAVATTSRAHERAGACKFEPLAQSSPRAVASAARLAFSASRFSCLRRRLRVSCCFVASFFAAFSRSPAMPPPIPLMPCTHTQEWVYMCSRRAVGQGACRLTSSESIDGRTGGRRAHDTLATDPRRGRGTDTFACAWHAQVVRAESAREGGTVKGTGSAIAPFLQPLAGHRCRSCRPRPRHP